MFRLRATCPFTPAGSWRSAGSTASPRRPLPGQIATPARSRRAPLNLPVRSRPRPVLRGLRSRPAASVPGQIDLRAFLRFLPGNLLRLRPSSAPAAAPATIARRACFPSAPGGLRLCRLPSSALRTGVFLCRSGLRRHQALAPLRLQMLRQAPQLQLLLRSSLGARLRPPLQRCFAVPPPAVPSPQAPAERPPAQI